MIKIKQSRNNNNFNNYWFYILYLKQLISIYKQWLYKKIKNKLFNDY